MKILITNKNLLTDIADLNLETNTYKNNSIKKLELYDFIFFTSVKDYKEELCIDKRDLHLIEEDRDYNKTTVNIFTTYISTKDVYNLKKLFDDSDILNAIVELYNNNFILLSNIDLITITRNSFMDFNIEIENNSDTFNPILSSDAIEYYKKLINVNFEEQPILNYKINNL